jgi:predicted MFS family arabinose efflux permease
VTARDDRTTRTVLCLGAAQTLAFASSYYLPAMLAVPMARDLGLSTPAVFAAFSMALAVSAALGPLGGRLIDRHGGRPVLMGTNGVFALGLALLALAQGPVTLALAWFVIGVAMSSGLYEAAFSALVRLWGHGARNAITGITLIAGFASTVGWPLSALLEAQIGWRGTCLAWAALHLLVGLPLNAAIPRARPAAAGAHAAAAPGGAPATAPDAPALTPRQRSWAFALLAFVFAAAWFVSTAMAAHLPQLLQTLGTSPAGAVAAVALVGPAQVAGRLLEFGWLSRWHALLSARLAALAHPLGGLTMLLVGVPQAGALAAAFTVLHGTGNGILTIAKGSLPLAVFGSHGFGERKGWLMMPARIAQAGAPLAFGLALERFGAASLWLTVAVTAAAFLALCALPHRESALQPLGLPGERSKSR